MVSWRFWLAALSRMALIALMVLAWAGLGQGVLAASPHDDCGLCHLDSPPVAANVARAWDKLCDGCHEARVARDHPVGMTMTQAAVPLPLPGGRVACVSCHQWHVEPKSTGLWRQTDDLCLDCHRN